MSVEEGNKEPLSVSQKNRKNEKGEKKKEKEKAIVFHQENPHPDSM